MKNVKQDSKKLCNVTTDSNYAVILTLVFLLLSCKKAVDLPMKKDPVSPKLYQVQKIAQGFILDGKWEKDVWKHIPALAVNSFMGKEPDHQPKTEAKLVYDADNIYTIFRVEDQYIRAVSEKCHDMVCTDSCVEFFFTPGMDISEGYFNLEMNCGGVLLMAHQTARGENSRLIATADCDQIKIITTMPQKVEPEITTPITWLVEYRIPFAMLEKYTNVKRPATGVQWRANFYKCGDKTSHPHWLTWSVVDKPEPDFHRPEFFGILEFD